MIFRGFRFGMLLQIAVGPMCLFIFQTAVNSGARTAMVGVLGIALVDALYILAAILGIGALLNKNNGLKTSIRYFGSAILILFGLSIILGVFGYNLIPSLNFTAHQSYESLFIKVMILTLSNPMTILFWVGVFSTKLADDELNQRDMFAFGFGAVLSTLTFMTGVSLAGSFANQLLPPLWMSGLNILVGLVLIGFGIKSVVKA